MATYPNGEWPDSALDPVPGQPGLNLEPGAAASWGRVRADVQRRKGWTPLLTDAYRAMDGFNGQRETFLRRYTLTYSREVNGPTMRTKVWQGRTYYLRKGMATAATPGTSNHGIGVAVDVTGLGAFGSDRYDDFAEVALEHGWDNVEGAAIGEPWHWRYRPANDRHRDATTVSNPGNQLPGGHIPTPTTGDLPDPLEEDVVTAQDKLEIATLVWAFQRRAGGPDMAAEMASLATVLGSTYQAVLGADAGEVARDAEDDTERRALWDQVVSTRADVQRADEITRAQLNALSTALDALAASKGVDPAAIRADVQAALAGLTATVTLSTPNGA